MIFVVVVVVVKQNINIELQLKENYVLFLYEYAVDFKMWSIVNLFIIYGKFFIHKCKWKVKKRLSN